jgi:hypothetical protein
MTPMPLLMRLFSKSYGVYVLISDPIHETVSSTTMVSSRNLWPDVRLCELNSIGQRLISTVIRMATPWFVLLVSCLEILFPEWVVNLCIRFIKKKVLYIKNRNLSGKTPRFVGKKKVRYF